MKTKTDILLLAKKVARNAAFTGLGLIGLSAMGPYTVERLHNLKSEDNISRATEKMTKEKFFACRPENAGAYQSQRGEKLSAVTNAAFFPPLYGIAQTYADGVKRISNTMPGLVSLAKENIGALSEIPEDYHKGYFETDLDRLGVYSANLARLGISVCLDSGLAAHNAGSAYIREHGMITINPALTQESMVAHLRRQMLRLEQEIVAPYNNAVTEGLNSGANFAQRFDNIEMLAKTRRRPPLVLSLTENPNIANFVELAPGVYNAPLTQLAPQPAPAATPAVEPSAAPPAAPVVKSPPPKLVAPPAKAATPTPSLPAPKK